MYFEALPTELVTHIFLSLPSISAAFALASTCHHFHSVYHAPKNKLLILREAANAEYGPIGDIIQLVTHNASQPAHMVRQVPTSDALLSQVVRVGRVAQRWEEIYPYKKWKTDYANRRLLSPAERFALRRAIYRLWLFSAAFHTPLHTRTSRSLPQVMAERAKLLHNYSTTELAEMLDVHTILRDTVANQICPSNGKIRQKFGKRFPGTNHQLLFDIHLNYPPAPSAFVPDGWFHNSLIASSKYRSRLQPTLLHESGGAEGWGDDISHYYVVEDMMKLNPEQLVHLHDWCKQKQQVEAFVREVGGESFVNNGETFSETLAYVLRQRGLDKEGLKTAIEDGECGIVAVEE